MEICKFKFRVGFGLGYGEGYYWSFGGRGRVGRESYEDVFFIFVVSF